MIRKLILTIFFITITFTTLFANQKNIEVFPSAPYDRYIIYEMLALFWAGIIGLVIIIRMKLKEIERIQKMGLDSCDHLLNSRDNSRSGSNEEVRTVLPPEGGEISIKKERKEIPLLD